MDSLEELKELKQWALCFGKTGEKQPLVVTQSWIDKVKVVYPQYFEDGNEDYIQQGDNLWLQYTFSVDKSGNKSYTGDLANTGATIKFKAGWLTYAAVDKLCRNSLMLYPVNRECQLAMGFVFTKDCPFAIIDLDRKEQLSQQEIGFQDLWIEKLNSYTERSVSGTGYHVIIKGKIDETKYPNSSKTGASGIRSGAKHKQQGIVGFEVYSQDRFAVVTEDVVEKEVTTIESRQKELDELCAALKEPAQQQSVESVDVDTAYTYDTDVLVVDINFHVCEILQSTDRETFLQLFEAHCNLNYDNDPTKSVYNSEYTLSYPSQSEADFALISLICRYCKIDSVVKAIFAQSELAKRPKATRVDYLNRMIASVRESEANTYAIPQFNTEIDEQVTNIVNDINEQRKTEEEAEKKALIDEFINKKYLDIAPETVLVNSRWQNEDTDPTYTPAELLADCMYATGLIAQLKRVGVVPSNEIVSFKSDNDISFKRLLDKGYITSKGFSISDTNAMIVPPVSSGWLYDLTKWSYQTRIKPILEVSVVSALAIASGIVGKMWQLPTGTGLNNYIILSARSGIGKEGLHTTKNDLVWEFTEAYPTEIGKLRRHIVDDDFVSGQALVKRCLAEAGSVSTAKRMSMTAGSATLGSQPARRYVSFCNFQSEFGKALAQMGDCRVGSPADTLKGQYLKLYTGSGKTAMLSAMTYSNADESISEATAPAFSVVGETTIAGYADALSPQMAQDGFLSRFITVTYKGRAVLQNKLRLNQRIPTHVLSAIKDLCIQEEGLAEGIKPRFVNVDFTEPAFEYNDLLEQLSIDMLDQAGDKEHFRQAWVRFQLKIMKLAGICAVCQNPGSPKITLQHMGWATRLVMLDIATMYEMIANGDTNLTGNSETTQVETMLDVFKGFVISSNQITLATRSNCNVETIKAMQAKAVVPIKYITTMLSANKSFINTKIGFNRSVDQALQRLVIEGAIEPVAKQTVATMFKTTGLCYKLLDFKGLKDKWQE